jgi:hypothetical protein
VTRSTYYVRDFATIAGEARAGEPVDGLHLSVLSIDLADIGTYGDLYSARSDLRVLFSRHPRCVNEGEFRSHEPLDALLSWAANFACMVWASEGDDYSSNSAHRDSARMAFEATQGLAFQGGDPAEALYMVLRGEPCFAIQNSPRALVSSAQITAAAGPGAVTLYTDQGGAAALAATALGIFLVYVATPASRGLGEGLETVAKEWALRLRPRRGVAED